MTSSGFQPIAKPGRPQRRSFSDNELLALPKPGVRERDPAAIAGPRALCCERCGRGGPIHWHHVKSRGAGGSDRSSNRVDLCATCHDLVHRGRIPRAELFELIRRREDRDAALLPRRGPTDPVLDLPAPGEDLPASW